MSYSFDSRTAMLFQLERVYVCVCVCLSRELSGVSRVFCFFDSQCSSNMCM